MGGCKCVFRKCKINSANTPSMHFFHFPAKHPEKMKLWVKYANAENILNLEKSKALNKVVCAQHFRDECFMNYKKDRITKTAVPTLFVLHEDKDGKVALDYETGECPEPVRIPLPTAKHLLMPESEKKLLNPVKRKLDEPEPNPSKIKINKSQDIIYLNLNDVNCKKNATLQNRSLDNPNNIATYDLKIEKFLDNLNTAENEASYTIETEIRYDDQEVISSTEQCMDQIQNDEKDEQQNDYVDELEGESLLIGEKHNAIENLEKTIENIKKENEIKIKALQQQLELKELELKKLKCNATKLPQQFKLNGITSKEQLFKSLKKYLSPSMSSFVRMEMFGNPEREWMEDEKEVSIELLQLGESVFSYVRDEWRFRLPPQKDVEQWLSAKE